MGYLTGDGEVGLTLTESSVDQCSESDHWICGLESPAS